MHLPPRGSRWELQQWTTCLGHTPRQDGSRRTRPEGSATCHSTAHPEKANHISIAKSYLWLARVTTATEQEVLGRTNCLLSLIRHRPHWKQCVQQFFYCCVCIRYRGNVYTKPLPSKDRGIFTEPLTSNDRGDTQTATQFHKPTLFSK
jgi:hypothetical protein